MITDAKKLVEQYTPKQTKSLKTDRQLCMLRFSPDGNLLAAACQDGSIRRWDESFAELPPIKGHGGWVQAIVFHPDGKRLFSADTYGALRCWPFADKEAKATWTNDKAHDGWIRALALSPDGKTLATCGRDQKIRLFSADDGKQTRELASADSDLFALAFHPDGKSLVVGDLFGVIKQWDLATGKSVREFNAKDLHKLDRLQDSGGVRCLAFDKDGNTLLAGGTFAPSGGFVQGTPAFLAFDWKTGKPTQTRKVGAATDGFLHDVHVHPAGFVMGVTSGQPGNGKFFFQRVDDAQPFFITPAMPNCHSLAMHPEGRRFAVVATSSGSNGNGRQLDAKGQYPGAFSPVVIWDLPPAK